MNLLKVEMYKLRKSIAFRSCLIVSALFAVLLPFALQQAVASGEPDVKNLSLSGIEVMGYGLNMPIFALIAAVFISLLFISGKFHFGTMKSYITKGFNRNRIFLAKLITCAAAVSIMYAVFLEVVLISGTIFLGFDPHGVFEPTQFAGTVIVSCLLFMAYTTVFTVVSFNIPCNGAAIAVNICLVSIFPTILQALDFVFGKIGIKISSLMFSLCSALYPVISIEFSRSLTHPVQMLPSDMTGTYDPCLRDYSLVSVILHVVILV